MTTALGIVQAAFGEIGIPAPISLITTGSVDVNCKNLIQNHARWLRNQTKLSPQKKTHSFATTASRSKYPLPEDFYGMVATTGQDRTNFQSLRGAYNDPIVNQFLYEYQITGSPYGHRIFGPDGAPSAATAGGQFQVVPTPAEIVTISFDYFSKNLFIPPYWTASSSITATEYRSANGNIYLCTQSGTTSTTPPSHTTGAASDGTAIWDFVSAPYETVRTDDDLCIYDDDVMIQGVIDRYRQAKKQPYNVDPLTGLSVEHKSLVERSVSRHTGSRRGRFDRGSGGPRYHIPYRGHI